ARLAPLPRRGHHGRPPETTPYGVPLTLENSIAQALEANFDIQIQRITTRSAVDNEAIARANFDPTIGASASSGQSQSSRTTVDANGNIFLAGPRNDTDDVGVSISQRTSLGTTVTGASGVTRRDSNRASSAALDPAYDSDVGITIRQPLLKGAGTSINNAAIERARLGTERSRADFTAQVFTVVRNIEVAYANLALSRELVGIRAFSLEVRKKLLEENRARRDTGVATDLEVLQAEVGVATAARDLLLSRQNARDSQDQLLRLLGHESFEHPVGPVALPAPPPPVIDLSASLERARTNTPEFFSALASIRQQEIDIRIAQNNNKPQLDLGGRAAYTNTDGTLRNSNGNLWDGNGYNWQVDLSVNLPWGFREEKARLRQAIAGRDRENLRLAQIEQTILVDVRDAVRALETGIENVRLSTLTATLSGREFEVEKARYDSGLSTFRAVQEAQDDYDQARLAELQAKVDLRTAQANLDRLEGTAPARYNLTLAP
ncbi:MAG: TolC family protein, partial [Burkholderiales bacterium]|nr:TolC family protein [Opitutaceae bacterium]